MSNVSMQPAKKKPGIVGIIVGIVLAVPVALIIAGIGFLLTWSSVTDATSYRADGTPVQLQLSANEEIAVWVQATATGTCSLVDPSGNDAELTAPSFDGAVNNYTLSFTYKPPTTGTYSLTCETSGAAFNFKVASMGAFMSILIGVIVATVVALSGIALLVVTLVRRAKWKARHASSGMPTYAPGQQPYAPGQQPYASTPQPYAPAPAQQPYPPTQQPAAPQGYTGFPPTQGTYVGPSQQPNPSYPAVPPNTLQPPR